MMRLFQATLAMILLTGAATACSAMEPMADMGLTATPTATATSAAPSPTDPPAPTGAPIASPSPATTSTAPPPVAPEKPIALAPEPQITLALADLSERLGIPLDEIQVVSVESVQWRDASLGCPDPGLVYAQVVTRGFLGLLEAGGEQYVYHTDAGRTVTLCDEDGLEDLPLLPVKPGEIMDGEPWVPVD